MNIIVTYTSIDRAYKRRAFKTLAGARKFAREWIGDHPTCGSSYAISDDGVGKITVHGCSLAELFTDEPVAASDEPDEETRKEQMTSPRIKITDVRKWGMYAIVAEDVDGNSWVLKHRFACDDIRFRPMLEKIEAAGSIDPAHWKKSAKAL